MKKFQNPFIVSLLFFIVSCSGNNSINDIKTLEQKALEIPPNFDLKPPLDIEQDLIDNELDSVESNEDLKEILDLNSNNASDVIAFQEEQIESFLNNPLDFYNKMFRFFIQKKWFLWAYLGSATILLALWLQVQIDVKINEWFGEFYDMIQRALGTPNAITMNEYMGGLYTFGKLAAMWIVLGLGSSFLTSHFLFRWRNSMTDWYHSVYDKARTI